MIGRLTQDVRWPASYVEVLGLLESYENIRGLISGNKMIYTIFEIYVFKR